MFDFQQSEKIDALAKALGKAQSEMPIVPKHGRNPHFKSTYAKLDDMLPLVKPILAKHGLSIPQFPISEGPFVGLKTILIHDATGQYMSASLMIQPIKAGAQDVGSTITYFRRYAMGAVLGIATEEDDDGNGASSHSGASQGKQITDSLRPAAAPSAPPPLKEFTMTPERAAKPVSEPQVKRLYAIAKTAGWTQEDVKALLAKELEIDSVSKLTQGDYENVCNFIQEGRT